MKDILNAKEEFRNLFILLKQNRWFKKICDSNQLERINGLTNSSSQKDWTYSIEKLIFKNLNLDSHRHIRPLFDIDQANAFVELSVSFEGENNPIGQNIYNSLNRVDTKFVIKCEYFERETYNIKIAQSSWHLDTHDSSKEIDFAHPKYHFEFGGSELNKTEGFSFGDFIIFDTFRIMHPPLDIVLAIDFVIKNFYSYKENYSLTQNELYKRYIHNARIRLWRPYALSFANNFESINEGVFTFDSNFSKEIIECERKKI